MKKIFLACSAALALSSSAIAANISPVFEPDSPFYINVSVSPATTYGSSITAQNIIANTDTKVTLPKDLELLRDLTGNGYGANAGVGVRITDTTSVELKANYSHLEYRTSIRNSEAASVKMTEWFNNNAVPGDQFLITLGFDFTSFGGMINGNITVGQITENVSLNFNPGIGLSNTSLSAVIQEKTKPEAPEVKVSDVELVQQSYLWSSAWNVVWELGGSVVWKMNDAVSFTAGLKWAERTVPTRSTESTTSSDNNSTALLKKISTDKVSILRATSVVDTIFSVGMNVAI